MMMTNLGDAARDGRFFHIRNISILPIIHTTVD